MNNGLVGRRTLKIFFAGAGMDGETRYELHGLTADVRDLTRGQLHEALREGGVPDDLIDLNREKINDLSKAAATNGNRPAVVMHR